MVKAVESTKPIKLDNVDLSQLSLKMAPQGTNNFSPVPLKNP